MPKAILIAGLFLIASCFFIIYSRRGWSGRESFGQDSAEFDVTSPRRTISIKDLRAAARSVHEQVKAKMISSSEKAA